MSELNNQLIESGGIQEQESLSSYVVGIKLENFQTDINSIKSDATLYQSFLELIKENAPIESGLKLRAIIKRYLDKKKEDVVEKKEDVVEKKEDVVKVDEFIERRKSLQIAARENTQAIDSINTSLAPEVKGTLDGKVEKQLQDIQSGQVSDITSEFLKSVGINSPEDIKNPDNQAILRARISTQVYLEEARNNPEFRTQFSKEIETLERNAPTLGIEQSTQAKSVERLLTDIPRDTRGQVVDTVTSLTSSNPDTLVTRTGDTLRFSDPKNEKYSYEIDLGKQPPRLAKSLNGLSISRDVKNASPEEQAKKDKYETTQKQLQKTSEIYNTATTQFWGIRRDEYTLIGANGENIYPSVFLSENRDTQRRYEELEGRLANSETPRDEKGTIIDIMLSLSEEMKSKNLSKLLDTGETENHGKIDKMIEGRREQLRILKSTLQDFSEAEKSAKDTPKPQPTSDDTFDEDASVSLNFLVENGLHHLGQRGFEELMNAWNHQHLESKNYQINLQDSPRIGTLQKKEFGDFIRKRYGNSEGTRNASLTQERKNLTNNDFRTNNWTDIKDRQDYLFGAIQNGDTAKNIPTSDINDSAENTSTQGEASSTLA